MRARTIAPLTLISLLAAVCVAVLVAALARRRSERAGPDIAARQRVAGTAQFLNVNNAVAAGYGEFRDAAGVACIDKPGTGEWARTTSRRLLDAT